LPYANVYWADKSDGTTSDGNGYFKLKKTNDSKQSLVISFIGYKNDTIEITTGSGWVDAILSPEATIDEVTIYERQSGSYISALYPRKTEVISTNGLQKLACCNLSESFENSATVDVGFSDAVTGAKQIQMLGLAGKYTQIMSEQIPSLRGLASTFGLSHIPGSWMESIQISKGTASVVNGYESTTGQINIEYKKPQKSEPFYLNLYGNSNTKGEMNLTSAYKMNERLSTMFFAHGSMLNKGFDHNHDSFLDETLTKQINLMNRWNYEEKGRFHSQFVAHYINETRDGGQLQYFNPPVDNQQAFYGLGIDIQRLHIFTKTGFILDKPATSIGFQASGNIQSQNSFFGQNNLNASDNNVYFNSIYRTYIKNTNHVISAGLSYMFDQYEEKYNDTSLLRNESVPGVFGEYTFTNPEKLTLIFGLRSDYNNQYGVFVTPRWHAKYTVNKKTTLRASAGKGYRSANVFSEFSGYLVSSRNIILLEDFKQEEAWNFGANITRKLQMKEKDVATVTLDYYRTNFINQIIADPDQSAQIVYFYNLDGKSYSNSFQAEISIEPLKGLEILTAFRYNDIKQTMNGILKEKPLVNKYKGLFNISYATKYDKWKFNLTTQLNGKVRLPFTGNNPAEYQLPGYSPMYLIVHGQITRQFKFFELYLGGENLTNYVQKNPIIAANDPFGNYFDASMIWGPLMGRLFYGGLRYSIK
ncbi:MAG: TonB-dependent receptor, partial [Bacteroidota bacterium]